MAGTTIDAEEIARFARLARTWWDVDGPFKPLHRLNPARLAYAKARLAGHFGRAPDGMRPFEGLRLADVGCGGGLIAEPMARLGFEVVGIDAARENVEAARGHAEAAGLGIDYRTATAESLAAAGETFDVVLALEIVEHVADLGLFLSAVGRLVRPGGAVLLSTINRTAKAYLLAVVGAEYVLGWLPRGTHDWSKFVRPSELAHRIRSAGLTLVDLSGLAYDPFSGTWASVRDLDVNYSAFAVRPLGA